MYSYSSIGFHTMELSLWLIPWKNNSSELLEDFKRFRRQTGNLKIYPDKKIYTDEKTPDIVISYCPRSEDDVKDLGIKWRIRKNVHIHEIGYIDILYVEINPKILGGIKDYITAATYGDMEAAVDKFNSISKSISPLLETFDKYYLNRIDYCFNISTRDLYTKCSAKQIMTLIKRSDVPYRFEEWQYYDKTSHRMKTGEDSFYLVNDSVHINCYSKYSQLKQTMEQNSSNKYNAISQSTLDKSSDIIRFEVQCLPKKAKLLVKENRSLGYYRIAPWENILLPKFCSKILLNYYHQTIGCGTWYTLKTAASLVKRKGYNRQKEDRIIQTLESISKYRSVPKAKQKWDEYNRLESFKGSLRDLSMLSINPVTIPREWGIVRIKNPYYLLLFSHLS